MRAAVLGAGALGTLVALHLVRRDDVDVDIIDPRLGIWAGASGTGEGKVHLGYVYGGASDATLRLLLEASARFAADFDRAIGRTLPWHDLVSSEFHYLVADTSSLTSDAFEAHPRRIADLATDVDGVDQRYLGGFTGTMCARFVRTADSGTTFLTPERSVDVPVLRAAVGSALSSEARIRHASGVRVVGVDRTAIGWTLGAQTAAGDAVDALGPYDIVVNCAWESAAALDRMTGRYSAEDPNLRLRAFLIGQSDGAPHAVTVTHGPFGDFVRFRDGRTYASWYPTGVLGFTQAPEAPAGWGALQAEALDDPSLVASMVDGLERYVPEVRSIRDISAHARIVVARGSTDIDDPASDLHDRSEAGVWVNEGWVSVRSPKLTTAPLLASRSAEVLQDVLS